MRHSSPPSAPPPSGQNCTDSPLWSTEYAATVIALREHGLHSEFSWLGLGLGLGFAFGFRCGLG